MPATTQGDVPVTPRWRWHFDGQPLPDQGPSARVPLADLPAGRHRLRLLDADGVLLDEVGFELRGRAGAPHASGAATTTAGC